ncbi:phosphohydrolase [Candidatus Pyrohabitans sp.]
MSEDINAIKSSCPGSTEIKRPKPEYVLCPSCRAEVEIWSDEAEAECEECGTIVRRTRDNLCINWCEYAEKCVGGDKLRALRGE